MSKQDLEPSIAEIEDCLQKNLGVDIACVRFLLGKYRQAQAVVDKLPKYADTGEPIACDMVWMMFKDPVELVVMEKGVSLAWRGHAAYSTQAAAEAAATQAGKDGE